MAADYYAILGVSQSATLHDIKIAFRKLAKIYHPDKNPNNANAKQLFEHVLQAYNTLSNPHSRKRYDDKLSYQTYKASHTSTYKKNKQKEWTFTDDDLKRREYYKTHYQKKKQAATTAESNKNPNTYSDYKYIMYAVPVAVTLLMFIISFFNPEPKAVSDFKIEKIEALPVISLNNGAMPYSSYFGETQQFDTKHELQLNNSSNYDAVIIVYDVKTNQYLQHSYLKNSFLLTVSRLPSSGVYFKCLLGLNWDKSKIEGNTNVIGGFDSVIQYQNWKANPLYFNNNSNLEIQLLTVIGTNSLNKKYISTKESFFEK